MKRISILDGFRALAIIPVIFFHYFSRWTPPMNPTNFYPYGETYRDIPLFQYGFLGVEFFFVISGFVICMTLSTSKSGYDFAIKRVSRLWPAMLLCSVLTFVLLKIIPQELFSANAKNFLPSLTFIDPFILGKALKQDFEWMDGAYWSLFVEVRFYFWAALIYFFSKSRFLEAFFAFTTAGVILFFAGQYAVPGIRTLVEYAFFPKFLPLFAMGVGFFYLYDKKREKFAHFIILESLAVLVLEARYTYQQKTTHSLSMGVELGVYAAVVGAFYIFVYRPQWFSFFGWKPVSAVGAASYSLYLLHQNAGVAMIRYITDTTMIRGEFVAIGVIAALIGASMLIYRHWETAGKKLMLGVLLPQKTKSS